MYRQLRTFKRDESDRMTAEPLQVCQVLLFGVQINIRRCQHNDRDESCDIPGAYFGIQSPSDFYLASHKITPAMLLKAVETIAVTVKAILTGCQELGQVCAA